MKKKEKPKENKKSKIKGKTKQQKKGINSPKGLSAMAEGLSDLNRDIEFMSSFRFSYSAATCC